MKFNVCSNDPQKLTDIIKRLILLQIKNQSYLKEDCKKSRRS